MFPFFCLIFLIVNPGESKSKFFLVETPILFTRIFNTQSKFLNHFIFSVTYSQEWEVNYLNKIKCALKGSTTVLSGSFTYPKHLNIMETFWTVDPSRDKETLDVSKDPQYKNRVDHILNKNHTFIFKLSNVTRADKKMYCIRIVTDVEKEKYLGYPGIDLQVTGTVKLQT